MIRTIISLLLRRQNTTSTVHYLGLAQPPVHWAAIKCNMLRFQSQFRLRKTLGLPLQALEMYHNK